jgi:hypothetical protein
MPVFNSRERRYLLAMRLADPVVHEDWEPKSHSGTWHHGNKLLDSTIR